MRAKIAKWSPGRRGVLALMGGVAGGQLLALLSAPVLGRLYPPTEYGPFAVINAAVMPLGVIAALRLELAIPLPRREGMARDIAWLGLRICVAFGGAGLLLSWIARDSIAHALGQGAAVAALVPWVPIIAAEVGAFAVLNQLAIRYQAYGAIARRNLLQAVAMIATQVIAGFAGWGSQGLALGLAIGQAAGIIALAISVSTPRRGEHTVYASSRQILRRFRSFPLLLAPAGLLNMLGFQAPVLLASALFGVEVSGWLGMTQRILLLPVALLGSTLAQVYLGEFGEAKRSASQSLAKLFVRTSKRLAVVGLVVAAVVMLLGPMAFSIMLGDRWANSGLYAQALAAGVAVQMVASPLSQTLIVMGKNLQQFVWDTTRLVVCSAVVYGGYRFGLSALETMWILGVSMALMYGWLWAMSWRAVTAIRPPRHAAVSFR